MKKISLIIVAMTILFFSTVANAETVFSEPFSIRDGIAFGMKENEVENVERFNGNYDTSLRYKTLLSAQNKDVLQNMAIGLNGCSINTGRFKYSAELYNVSGQLVYLFNVNNELSAIKFISEYSFSSTPVTDQMKLVYGPAHFTTKQNFPTNANDYYYICQKHASGKLENYSAWLLEYSDSYILLESVLFSAKSQNGGRVYYENITYSPISPEYFESLITKIPN